MPGVAIGSYPFFKDGKYGANFVVRSDNGELVDRTAKALEQRLADAGIEPFPGGIEPIAALRRQAKLPASGAKQCRTTRRSRRSS